MAMLALPLINHGMIYVLHPTSTGYFFVHIYKYIACLNTHSMCCGFCIIIHSHKIMMTVVSYIGTQLPSARPLDPSRYCQSSVKYQRLLMGFAYTLQTNIQKKMHLSEVDLLWKKLT